jgi:diguanylate cyclase (GGDEF)-like protein
MCIFVVFEVIILWGCLAGGGIFRQLDENAKDIVEQKVINRSSYLETEMNRSWSNLESLTEYINDTAQMLSDEGVIDFDTLDSSSSNATPLLSAVLDEMIGTMRQLKVTGIYVIFSDEDLDEGLEDKPGIYLRDADPLSSFSSDNGDLLFERAPLEIVTDSNIATDTYWHPRFEFAKQQVDYYDFFYVPYQEALHNEKDYTVTNLGYWGKSFTLNQSNTQAITYSLPLVNHNGKVYGVVGIDITLDYLKRLLPNDELMDGGKGTYLLAMNEDEGLNFENLFLRGTSYKPSSETTKIEERSGDYYVESEDEMYAAISYLNIYNSNIPYSNQKWALIGIVKTEDLFSFSRILKDIVRLATLVLLAISILISFVTSYMIARPVRKLLASMKNSDAEKKLQLSRTNIVEIDRLAEGMEKLDQELRDTSMEFSKILKMSSVDMAGFEYDKKTGKIYLTDNFFEVFLQPEKSVQGITAEELRREIQGYDRYMVSRDYDKNEFLYKIPDRNKFCYVSMRLVARGNVYTGVVENVTAKIVEKQMLEYERDHDMLTGLWNRRAFRRKGKELFKGGKKVMKTAALVMLDLDQLKQVNDNYGHEIGDRYIIKAAHCFKENVPEDCIVARISGDEFILFFYGYDSEDMIRTHVDRVMSALKPCRISLDENVFYDVNASGGIAWYPRNTDSFEILQQYADYAMYRAKHAGRGRLAEFDSREYEADSDLMEEKRELERIISEEAVQFFFQPIVSVKTGKLFAYEALMRVESSRFHSPLDVLKVAKQEDKLEQIEILTWMHAMEAYAQHARAGIVDENCHVFINSISNQMLPIKRLRELEEKYPEILHNVVLEVTEGEMGDEEYHQKKKERMKRWQAGVAVDDYGSGYNGDLLLLAVAPDYIKLDMEIVRSIDKSPDKCKLMENIVTYAHERNMKIVAEGVETLEELTKVINLGADYIQGYLVSRPMMIPPKIKGNVSSLIREISNNHGNEDDNHGNE